jgi:AraC-like DNA-binding protein
MSEMGRLIRISTDDLPEKDRLAIWTEEFGKTILKVEFKPAGDAPFFQSASFRNLPGLSMSTGEGSGFHVWRRREHIADGADIFFLQIALEGRGQSRQLGREIDVGSGEAFMLSPHEVTESLVPGERNRIIGIAVPRQALLDRLPNPEASFMRLIPAGNEAVRLLTGYLSLLDSPGLEMPADGTLTSAFVTHVHDLFALALGPTRDTWDQAKGGLQAARLHAIKQDILAHLGRPDLSVNAVATRQGISPRYIQKLFDLEGTTFTEFVLSERLSRARRMLADPRFAGRTIASIAYDAGFADLSNFNRGFRQRYGMTPSDVRAAGTRNGGTSA